MLDPLLARAPAATKNTISGRQVANPVGQVQWTRDEFGLGIIRDLPSYPRYQMIGDDHEGIFSLEVQRVELEDDAEFQCQVGAAAGAPGIRLENIASRVTDSCIFGNARPFAMNY
ncbi:MAG: hypothetical protein AAGD96_11380 [Chloroflexota bacterium]